MAFRDAFGPIGEERMDWRFAKMTAILARAFSGSDIKVADCLVKFETLTTADIEARSVANMRAYYARTPKRKVVDD